MTKEKNKVRVEVAPWIEAGNFLRKRGFYPAFPPTSPYYGAELDELDERVESEMGILYPDPKSKVKPPRKIWIGTIQFGERTEKHWIIRLYGYKWLHLLKATAEEMALKFGVDIDLLIVREQPRKQYVSYYGYPDI
ncbi:hypothetical protein J7M23_02010 [Candidatus Sumerlaeota bacterium]|nr:hypothetical protein [Candidatus Sumerlaeota bacterium]